MPTFVFDKLVRDKTVERLQSVGAVVHAQRLSSHEHVKELKKKLVEEAREVMDVMDAADANELVCELADVYEVLEMLLKTTGVSLQQVQQQQQERRTRRGGFEQGVKITQVHVPQDEPSPQLAKWVRYYRQQSHRYPEIADSKMT